MKEQIIEAFQKESSSLTVVVATIAWTYLKLFIWVPQLTLRTMHKRLAELEGTTLQQKPAKYNRHGSDKIKSYVSNLTKCRRLSIYKKFLKGENAESNNPWCSYCDVCFKAYKCGKYNDSIYKNKFFIDYAVYA